MPKSTLNAANDQSWNGKVVFITGAGAGIGRATALSFAKRGAALILAGRRETPLKEVEKACHEAGSGKILVISGCDVSHEKNIIAALEKIKENFGRLDVAFNNAGIAQPVLAGLSEIQTDDYDTLMRINLRGIFLSMKYEIPLMLKTGGSIINMASSAGILGCAGASIYSASKFAVVGMTKCAAMEYAKHNIRINAICPGFVKTDLLDTFTAGSAQARALAHQPNGRFGKPEEIAETVFNMAQPSSAFLIGAAIVMDGGITAGISL